MIWIIVVTMCGIGPQGFTCHSFTPPVILPAREMCDVAADFHKRSILAAPPPSVKMTFIKSRCLQVATGEASG